MRPEVLGTDHWANGMHIREKRVMVHNDVAIFSGASNSDVLDYASGEEEDVCEPPNLSLVLKKAY